VLFVPCILSIQVAKGYVKSLEMVPIEDKIGKPREFTDAEAEAFTRYLTKIEKYKKKTLVDVLLKTPFGRKLIQEWVKKGFKEKGK